MRAATRPGSTRTAVALGLGACLALGFAAPASGAVGSLAYAGCISGEYASGPSGSGACSGVPKAASLGGDSGLDELLGPVISPDGQSAYTVSSGDSAIARFDRSPATGALVFRDCLTGETESGVSGSEACADLSTAQPLGLDSGLQSLNSVAISPDGGSVYATSFTDSAVSRFDRDLNSGALTFAGCLTGETTTGPAGTGACATIPSHGAFGGESGLSAPAMVALSPDGESVYVGARGDSAVASFDRDQSTGALTYRGCITGETESGPGGSGACVQIPAAKPGAVDSGIDELDEIAVSADGRSLYAVSAADASVARFGRDPSTGALTYRGCVTGETQSGPVIAGGSGACARILSAESAGNRSGLEGAGAIALDPLGRTLYVAAEGDDAVARFDREPGSGALAYVGCWSDDPGLGAEGTGACSSIAGATGEIGFDAPRDVTVSPDGRSVYVAAAGDDAIVNLERDRTTGELAFGACISGNAQTAASGTCAAAPVAGALGASSGFDQIGGVAVSPDGADLYATALADDAIARFGRELDRDPPETRITRGPRKRTTRRKARFRFSSDEAASTFECSVDRGDFKACESPLLVGPRGIRRGRHRIEVVAIDDSGNGDLTPAKRKWRVKPRKRKRRQRR